MLKKSDTNIANILANFTRHNLEVGLLVPTETGVQKSIMDATLSVREYFLDTAFHDYDAQAQGPDAKVVKQAFFVHPTSLEETTVSLYRPMTKSGDPRIWFSKLKGYAAPYNLLAVIVKDKIAYVVNCSDKAVLDSIENTNSPLGEIASATQPEHDPIVEELLGMIRDVSTKGYVRTLRGGDTGIGMTLETLLGIEANTRRSPDYKGIELKAKRLKKGGGNRVTLFSKSPDWELSPIGSAWNLLQAHGRDTSGKLQLYHELNATAPNSYGLCLQVDGGRDWLKQNYCDPETGSVRHDATWPMDTLRMRLREKHPQTFWVSAKCRGKGADEEFHYVQVEHTKQPSIRNFDALIEAGVISLDYTLSQKGPMRARDHGYLFKIHPSDFPALFPPSEVHVLA